MAYVKKDVTFVFIMLLAVTTISFALFTSYTERPYNDLTTDYESKVGELTNVTTVLQQKKSKLDQTTQELQVTQDLQATLSEQYGSLRTQKELLEADTDSYRGAAKPTLRIAPNGVGSGMIGMY